VLASSCDQLWT